MATLLAPYNTAMQLGTGFNSFTQQICVNDAVTSSKDIAAEMKQRENTQKPIAQDVTYKTSIVDKVTDVTNEMNVNAAFAIKYDAFNAKGKFDFLNTSKIKESDVTFLISVKVVNQVIYDHSLINFNPVDGVPEKNFTEVYGDSFVSGYQEGGTFTAVISVKARDQDKAQNIKADATVVFTKAKKGAEKKDEKEENTEEKPPAKIGEKREPGKDENGGWLDFGFKKGELSFLNENETTISVSYNGGGQGLKSRKSHIPRRQSKRASGDMSMLIKPALADQDWTFETMRNAALRFPSLVAVTPMRTHAILTKYTALRSYHTHFGGLKMPSFEMAGVYSTLLQEAYLDFKTIAKNLQVLAYDVSAGQMKLLAVSEARKKLEQATKPASNPADSAITTIATSDTSEEEEVNTPPLTGESAKSSGADDTTTETPPQRAVPLPRGSDGKVNNSGRKQKQLESQRQPEKKQQLVERPYTWKPLLISHAYPPTLQGLEDARSMVRTILIRIVQEINILSKFPEAAMDEERVAPHMSPFLFKELLPVGEPIKIESQDENEMEPAQRQLEKIKASGGRQGF